ncbi:MAG: hypothetical protein K2L15_00855, partial [Eubacteriales bacterium]|nr:hypothetical protein [Eubacteriales bacterium]
NILPNLTSFSITAPELVEFSGNDFSNVTSFSHNLPKVEKFNNNKFPKIETLKFSPSFQVLTEFCGNDFRGVKSFNSFSLPYIKKFNENNFSSFKDGFTWSVANGAGSLEEFCNNDFSGLLSSKKFQIGDSNGAGNYYDLSNLKRIVGNNFGNVGRINIWSANSQEDVDIYEKEFKDNIFGSGTHTISMSGSFGTLQISSNTLRNLWLNRGTFGVIKDLDLPKVTDFSIINATIDEMINVNLPNATIFNLGSNKPIIRKMINVNIPKIGNLQLGTADNPMELLQDCTVKWLNTSYIKEIVNLSQTEPNLGLNVHLANTGIERFTIGNATFTNDYGLHNNKIRDIDELAKSVKDKSNAIEADINITIYGQKPEINIYTDEDSKVLTFDEIFKASDAATEAGNDLTYTVTSIRKGDGTTVSNLPQADTTNKQITFDDIDSGTVAEVEVIGNVKIGNREQSLTNGSNKTVVTITFLGNMEKNPVITGIDGENIEDLTINVRDVDSYTIDKLKEDIEAKVGDTDIKADVKVEILGGSIKKPEAGFAVVTRIKYSVITSANKTAEAYRNITVTNYLPVISWTTENLFLHKQVARITNTTELIDKLKEDVTISDFEATN